MIAQSTPANLALREAVFTGLGFALGFGWLWFPALQGFWLPEFLWGGVFDGGGTSIFCLLLVAGFFGAGLLGGRVRALRVARPAQASATNTVPASSNGGDIPIRDVRASRLLHWVHAATFALMAVSLLPPTPTSGVRLYLPVICMALAALLQGFFWGGAVLALPPRLAAASFVIAAFAATVFSGLVSLASPGLARAALLLLAVLAAWAAAYGLARTLRLPRPEPKRPRGRPSKSAEQGTEEESEISGRYAITGRMALSVAGLAVMLLALAAGFAERIFSPSVFFASPLAAGLFAIPGAALGFMLCGNGLPAGNGVMDNGTQDFSSASVPAGLTGLGRLLAHSPVSVHPASAVCLALGLCGIALVLPEPLASPVAFAILSAGEGCISIAAVTVLAGPSLLPPLRRSALALGAAFILSNLGSAAAGIPTLLSASPDMPMLSRAAGSVITAVALLLFAAYRRQTRVQETPDAEPVQEIPPAPAEPETTGVTFTTREREILRLIRQGLNNRGIAETLHVQEVTVRFHLRNLYQKTGLSEREELAALDTWDTEK